MIDPIGFISGDTIGPWLVIILGVIGLILCRRNERK